MSTQATRVEQIQTREGRWYRLVTARYVDAWGQTLKSATEPAGYFAEVSGHRIPLTFAIVAEARADGRVRTVSATTAEQAEADTLADLRGGIGREAGQRLRRRLYERGIPYDRHVAAAERLGIAPSVARHFRALTSTEAVRLFETA